MKGINVYAGTGTLTRAFLNQGVEIVWAQEDSDLAAQVYQYNFPDIPFCKRKLQEIDISTIPDCDLLLASLRVLKFRFDELKLSRINQNEYIESQKQEVKNLIKLISYKTPRAVCFTLPVTYLNISHEIMEMLSNQGYFNLYRVMDGEQCGGVPFKGRKIYVVGFRSADEGNMFYFPSPTKKKLGINQLLDRSQRKEDVSYRLPEQYEELFLNTELKNDKIYQVVHQRTQDNSKQLTLRSHLSCPVLTHRSSREYFVVDGWGPRRLSVKEYLQLQGIDPEMFTEGMSPKDIWSAMNYIGAYQVELRLAVEILGALRASVDESPEKDIWEQAADYLIRDFEPFLNSKKKIGLLCMPTGTGKSKVLKYSITELIKATGGKWKIVILASYSVQCGQIELLFRDRGFSCHLASSCQEIYDFMLNEQQILISSYVKWETFINQYQPLGIHTGLIIFGLDTEVGWGYLKSTKEYLPQVIYMGLTSMPDSKAIELFGPVLYQYTMSRAIDNGLLLPVYVERLFVDIESVGASLSGSADILHTEKFISAIAEEILDDLNTHSGKAIVIASSFQQAVGLKERFDMAKMENKAGLSGEDREAYVLISSSTPADRKKNLSDYIKSPQGILIVVDMWSGLSIPEITHCYVLSIKSLYTLNGIISLISRPCPGKQYGRIVAFEAEVQEAVRSIINITGESEQFFHFCDCIRSGQYEEAGVVLRGMKQTDKSLAAQIEQELSFLFTKQTEPDGIDQKQLQLMGRLWLLTSKASTLWLNLQDLRAEDKGDSGENASGEDIEKQQLEEALTNQSDSESTMGIFKNSAEKGSALENALLRLLRNLFIWNPEDNPELDKRATEVMAFLRKVSAGTQNGRDIELVYLDETGQKRRCYFECKYVHSRQLKEENILAKILQVQREAKEEIEHWILVAPNARLDNYSVALFEEAERNPGKYYPIKKIQVWNEENQIQDLLSIEPELYNIFFQNQAQSQRENREKQQLIQTWKHRIAPVILLPEGLRRYPFQPQNLIFDLQNNLQERNKYEELYHHHARLYYYNENGVLSQECLEEDMLSWLYSDTGGIKVITGEYGDGKTFFLYCLCRRLLKEFIKNPQKNYLPVFISLKNLKTDKSPEELIERRMKQLGCNYPDFQMLKENFHVLICLDGFDEISSTIDYNTIQQNARLLAECCEYLYGVNIIITSRKQCFYENKVNEWLCKRLGGFEVLSIAPIKSIDQENFILSKVEENDRFARWEQLNATGKIHIFSPFASGILRRGSFGYNNGSAYRQTEIASIRL